MLAILARLAHTMAAQLKSDKYKVTEKAVPIVELTTECFRSLRNACAGCKRNQEEVLRWVILLCMSNMHSLPLLVTSSEWCHWHMLCAFWTCILQGSFYAANWLILPNCIQILSSLEISVNQVRKDLACMLWGSSRLFMTACPGPIYFARVHFSPIFARPEWSLLLTS